MLNSFFLKLFTFNIIKPCLTYDIFYFQLTSFIVVKCTRFLGYDSRKYLTI